MLRKCRCCKTGTLVRIEAFPKETGQVSRRGPPKKYLLANKFAQVILYHAKGNLCALTTKNEQKRYNSSQLKSSFYFVCYYHSVPIIDNSIALSRHTESGACPDFLSGFNIGLMYSPAGNTKP